MKEFNLEEAKKGAKLCTRMGKKLVERHISETFISGSFYMQNGELAERAWGLDGKLLCVDRADEDLMIDEEPKEYLQKFISKVDHPSHYNAGNIECIDAMVAAFGMDRVETFCRINAFKYIWRANHKGHTREDLEKARWYIDKSLQLLNE